MWLEFNFDIHCIVSIASFRTTQDLAAGCTTITSSFLCLGNVPLYSSCSPECFHLVLTQRFAHQPLCDKTFLSCCLVENFSTLIGLNLHFGGQWISELLSLGLSELRIRAKSESAFPIRCNGNGINPFLSLS